MDLKASSARTPALNRTCLCCTENCKTQLLSTSTFRRQGINKATNQESDMEKIIWGTVPQGDIIPMEYFVFWSVGGLMVFLTAALIIPRLIEFTRIGIQIRDRHNLIFLPLSSTVYRLIMAFPLIASILKYITFVSPLFAYTAQFIIKSYEGLILRFFTQVLVLYLGTIENTMTALGDVTPTKVCTWCKMAHVISLCPVHTVLRSTSIRMLSQAVPQGAANAALGLSPSKHARSTVCISFAVSSIPDDAQRAAGRTDDAVGTRCNPNGLVDALCLRNFRSNHSVAHDSQAAQRPREILMHKAAFADNGNSESMFHIWRRVLSAPRSQRKATVFEDCFSRRIRCIYRHLSLLCCGHLFQEILSS